ncbi:AlwI family type II restriction endonuclease, partial [Cetobacterium sp.]|uniref:AlwI family type II restriction endonuclease n=1 Tax=Cetobacterium sp. TaxID=2071632 RepID=UPI003EE73542
YSKLEWNREKQKIYAKSLTENNIFEIKEKTPEKDARVKTSSLVDLGILTKDRNLTEVGEYITNLKTITESKNIFGIREESFIYLKQLLKFQLIENPYKEFKIKPLLALIYALIEGNNELSFDMLTFVIPQCKTYDEIKYYIENNTRISPYEYVMEKIKEDYTDKIEIILNSKCNYDHEIISALLSNRKSREYSKEAIDLYENLKEYHLNKDKWSIGKKYEYIQNLDLKKISKKSKTKLSAYIFGYEKITTKLNQAEVIEFFENTELLKSKTEKELLKNYCYLYYYGIRLSNLMEYKDLNLRYIKITDIFFVEGNNIKLEVVPYYYFKSCIINLIKEPLLEKKNYVEFIEKNLDLKDMYPSLNINLQNLIEEIKIDYPTINLTGNLSEELKLFTLQKRKEKFEKLIDQKFDKENLIKILEAIKLGKKDKVKKLMNCEADLPTIFEYIIGIIWHILNDRRDDLYEILNLYLDADLLPQRFAAGGKPDIIFKHLDHDQIIEVTLTTQDNQRRLELEPVSRHLGNHILTNNGKPAYAVFIAPYLDNNVLVNFRSQKYCRFYDRKDRSKFVESLEILPLDIDNMIYILNKDYKYLELYKEFNILFNSKEKDGVQWYYNEIFEKYSESTL